MYSQSLLDSWGSVQCAQNSSFRLNSFESNTVNLYNGKDWEISAMMSGSKNIKSKTSLYSLAVGKRIGNHYLYARFTPGISNELIFNTNIQVVVTNPVRVETQLQKTIKYQEELGLGYSYRFTSNFTVGFSLRYFQQEFSEDIPSPVITDSVNYIIISNNSSNSNFWRGDLGFTYSPFNWFNLSVTSINLVIAEENAKTDESSLYSIKKEKGISVLTNISLSSNSQFNLGLENKGSFVTGLNYTFPFSRSSITIGGLIFHDKYQNPFIAGIIPSINYSTDLFSFTLGAVKYFEARTKKHSISEFTSNGIHNLANNMFSSDQIIFGVNVALSLLKEHPLKIDELTIDTDIYPALSDIYSDNKFATANVTNKSDKPVLVRPASYIPELNKEKIYSPTVIIEPNSSRQIPFFTFIDNDVRITKREIKQAEFYIENDNEIEDQIKKPILINDLNAWDGKVTHLKYFVFGDLKNSEVIAKNILTTNSIKINKARAELKVFEKIKILFAEVFKDMLYVSDRRASTEIVQFPTETLKLKGGDCDDLSVCFSSILESVGIETAFVDYQNNEGLYHVNLLVNTTLSPDQLNLITKNDKKVIIRKDDSNQDCVWIPLEPTNFKDFATSWSIAAEKFETEAIEQFGMAKEKVFIIDIK